MIQPLLGDDRGAALVRDKLNDMQEDRHGELILELAAGQDDRLAALLLVPLPSAPPTWFVADEHDFPRGSLRLAIAERLHHEGRHADCLAWIEGVEEDEVYSASLLMYLRAVASRQVVDYEGSRTVLDRLEELGEETLSPSRRAVLRELRRELGDEDPEGLQHVARLMRDADRRLAIGRLGNPTQTQQQRALDGLDELIKELEEQQKQQCAQSSDAGGMGSPADESRPSDLKASGEVDRKRFAAGEGWGNLPPAEREKLAQDLTRGYPERYRQLISEYFEAIAEEAPSPNEPTTDAGESP